MNVKRQIRHRWLNAGKPASETTELSLQSDDRFHFQQQIRMD